MNTSCYFNMFRLVFAWCVLAVIAAAPTDEKTFPSWPDSFSMTILITEPFNTAGGARGEQVSKIWYDGDASNVKRQIDQHTVYALRNYNGRGGVLIHEDDKAGVCELKYDKLHAQLETRNPLPPPQNAEFLGVYDVNGEQVEQWQFDVNEPKKGVIKTYIKQQEGVAVPVRFEVYDDLPPPGSDMILPTVVEVRDFSASKPDSSVFEIDTSKCKEVSDKELSWIL